MIENIVSSGRVAELLHQHQAERAAGDRNKDSSSCYVFIMGSSTDRNVTLRKTRLGGCNSFVSSTDAEFLESGSDLSRVHYQSFSKAASSASEGSDRARPLLYRLGQAVLHDDDLFASDRVLHGILNADTLAQFSEWLIQGPMETQSWLRLAREAFKSTLGRSTTGKISPRALVDLLTTEYEQDQSWVESVSEILNERLPVLSLSRILRVWHFSEREMEDILDVDEGAVDEWQQETIPNSMAQSISELAAATDLLIHHIKRDRIAAVVRRPIRCLDGQSLVALLSEEGTGSVLRACRDMFDFNSANG